MNGTDNTYRRAAALLVPVLLLLAFLAIALVPAALAQSPPAVPGAAGTAAATSTATAMRMRFMTLATHASPGGSPVTRT